MVKVLKLFFNTKDKQHYYIPDDKLICNHCNKDILELVIFQFNWSKKSYMQTFCIDCIKKRNGKGITPVVKEEYIALIVDEAPKYSHPIFIRSPNLSPSRSDISVFEAGKLEFREKDNPTSNYNKLRCARRINKIDIKKQEKQLKERTDELRSTCGRVGDISKEGIGGIDAYLKDIQEAVPLLEAGDKKLLTNKKK